MKNLILLLFVFVGIGITNVNGQDYKSAVGLRLGYPTSVTYKSFINETAAFEIYGGFRSYSGYNLFNVSAAYQIHNEFPDVENLKWYYGGGAGVAFYSFDNEFLADEDGLSVVINGYLGLEYTLADTPISFSVDWVPGFYIGGYGSGFGADGGTFAIRYILSKD